MPFIVDVATDTLQFAVLLDALEPLVVVFFFVLELFEPVAVALAEGVGVALGVGWASIKPFATCDGRSFDGVPVAVAFW